MISRRASAAALSALLAASLGALVACSGGPADEPSASGSASTSSTQPASPPPTTSAPAGPSATTTTTSSTPTPTPTPPHPVSIEALVQRTYDGRDLVLGEVLASDPAYTRHAVTYASGDLTISGVMNVPTGAGPFPVVVLAHGYIDPAIYTTGRGMMREQDFLARRGFAVLHVDYRNHAGSSDDPDSDLELRLGYTDDVINAVLAVRSSGRPELDGERVAIFGRSMGGGVTYNALVAQPGLVDAAVVYAPVSSLAADNFNRWQRAAPGDDPLSDAIIAAYGTPEESPDFWAAASPRTSFDRITEPILVQHGTADESCPYEWTEATVGALQAAGKDVELVTWPGEPHAFEAAWPESMERTVAFLQEHLV